eukprot:jgi/Chrzof1/629/Cz01g23020.t1
MGVLDMHGLMPAALWQEGLNSGSLQELLDNIDKRTEQVRFNLLNTFGTHLQQQPHGVDKEMLAAMSTLATTSGYGSGPEQYLADCAQKYLEIQTYVENIQAELKAAQAAADLEATLKEFQSYIENGQYNEAAWSVVQLRKVLESNSGSADTQAYPDIGQVQTACSHCEQVLSEAFESSCHEAFDVELSSHVLTITTSLPSGGDVGDLWAAMERAGMATPHLQWIADTFIHDVLPPVLLGHARLHAHTTPGGESAIVQWQPAGHHRSHTKQQPAVVEHDCIQLFQVLSSALFSQSPSTLAAFGRVFWDRFVQLYEQSFIQQAEGASVEVLRLRQEAARHMEQQALQLGFTAADDELSTHLSRAIQKSYHLQQQQYLEQARDIISAYDPHAEPVKVGMPLPLDANFYERYQKGQLKAWELIDPPCGWDVQGPVLATGFYDITPSAIQMAMLMDDALSDACSAGEKVLAQAVVITVSKMATMYATMLPPVEPTDAAVMALLRHNDLQYLSNHMLLLPFLYGPTLEELVGGQVWFGSEATRLCAAAKQVFNASLAVQQQALNESLSQLNKFNNLGKKTKTGQEGITQRKAVRQVLHILSRIGRLLWPTLRPSCALDFSAKVLAPVFQRLLDDILSKKDIGVDECGEMVELCKPVVEEGVSSLLSGVPLAQWGDQHVDMKALLTEAMTQRTWGLHKLSVTLKLMDAKLADIVKSWESAELRRAGFSFKEVRKLVCALFEDTDYRAQMLQRMEVADID